MHIFALVLVGIVALAVPAGVRAQPADRHGETAEDWAWGKLRADQIADFDKRSDCNGFLDPKIETKEWDESCRQISPEFLENLLTKREWRDWLPRPHVRLRGAHVTGTLVLTDAEIKPEVWIEDSRIEGSLFLADSHWHHLLSLEGSFVAGELLAWGMRADSDLLLRRSGEFAGPIGLSGSKINGDLDMTGSHFIKQFYGNGLIVDGFLFMGADKVIGAKFDDKVYLIGAKVGRNLEMDGSSFMNDLDADSLSVTGSLLMRNVPIFGGDVILNEAKVDHQISMTGSTFSKGFNASNLNLGTTLFMSKNAKFRGEVTLTGAKIGGGLEMDGSSFVQPIYADRLRVTGSLFMRSGATFRRAVSLIGTKIDGNLDLRGAIAAAIDLSEADAVEFLVVGLKWWCPGGTTPNVSPAGSIAGDDELPVFWPLANQVWRQARCSNERAAKPPKLTLRNFHVADLQDDRDAWPPDVDLRGFRYDRLGGLGGDGKNDPEKRPLEAWLDWLTRSRDFSTQPYTELNSVLAVAGHREAADAVLLAGREQERINDRREGDYRQWLWLTILSWTAGYGIGVYTFYVLLPVLFFTVLGAVILCFSANARRHTLVWRAGASLHRLLPIIELYKEFTDFFDNPPARGFEPRNLKGWQVFYFAFHAVAGWALGLILLAAMSGLTQKG